MPTGLVLHINYIKFSNYYILYCCVVVALTAISEWHERLAFLQGLLLDASLRRVS
jgi:hypothetical protein